MANYKKILKNTTVSDIEIPEVGLTVPASGQITIEPGSYYLFAEFIDITGNLAAQIRNGDIVVNDGVDDLTTANGLDEERAIDYLKHPDTALNIRFLSNPERNNLFAAKNVQEAIEEAKATLQGKISVLPTFLNNGNTSNKWLALDGSFPQSDTTPAVINFDSVFAALTYINSNDNSDLDIEFYKNGTAPGDKFFTWEIRNARYAYKTDALTLITLDRGDTLHCFARRVGGGTGASSVLVTVLVQSRNSTVDEGQFPTLP